MAPYLWGTSLDGTSAVGALPPLDLDLSFSDLADNLDFAFSAHTEFHRGRWAFVIDPTYLSLSVDIDTPVPGVNPEVEIDAWIVEAWSGFKLTPNWEIIAGARWQDQEVTASKLPSPPLPVTGGDVNDNWLDWFAGVRFKYPLTDRWRIMIRADSVFAGDSDSSYNAIFFIDRRIGRNKVLNLGYRYFEDDYDNAPKYVWDMQQEGPLIGFSWAF